MNSKWHLIISSSKSILRIVTCIAALIAGNWQTLAFGLGLAELLGIAEELGDKR